MIREPCRRLAKSEESLWEEAVPQVERRVVAICAAQAGNEMVLERADGALSSITAMKVRWCQLEVNTLQQHKLLEGSGGFIVQF